MKSWILLFAFMAFVGVSSAQESEFAQWKLNRQAELKAEDGWLNLVGLYWMEANFPY